MSDVAVNVVAKVECQQFPLVQGLQCPRSYIIQQEEDGLMNDLYGNPQYRNQLLQHCNSL